MTVSFIGGLRGSAARHSWAVFHAFQFALQQTRRLLAQRAATRAVAAGAAKTSVCNDGVAGLAGGDRDLHEASPEVGEK
jgi:hypothetical protein